MSPPVKVSCLSPCPKCGGRARLSWIGVESRQMETHCARCGERMDVR